MEIKFYKYHGTGNDFIIIDNRNNHFISEPELIKKICNRRTGIGADGLILLENDNKSDFKMIYFNANGYEGSLCGNGSRCIVAFAYYLKIINKETTFMAVDGEHTASVIAQDFNETTVSIKMNNVDNITIQNDHYYMDNGSPHYVEFKKNLSSLDVFSIGKQIRNSELYKENGTNVNFVEINKDYIQVRTYERGVENETLSCGTGSVASALISSFSGKFSKQPILVKTLGGELKVSFINIDNKFSNIFLEGPAIQSFKGLIKI